MIQSELYRKPRKKLNAECARKSADKDCIHNRQISNSRS